MKPRNAAVAQQDPEAVGRSCGPRLPGLLEQRERRQEQDRGDDAERDEDAPPVGHPQQLAADHRTDHGRQAHHQDQLGEDPGRTGAVVHVADDRPGDDERGSGCQSLREAEAEEKDDVVGQRAQERREGQQQHADAQRGEPADAVAERTGDQLAQGQPHDRHGDRQLGRGLRGAEGACQVRQRRQVEVGHQRRGCGEAPRAGPARATAASAARWLRRSSSCRTPCQRRAPAKHRRVPPTGTFHLQERIAHHFPPGLRTFRATAMTQVTPALLGPDPRDEGNADDPLP